MITVCKCGRRIEVTLKDGKIKSITTKENVGMLSEGCKYGNSPDFSCLDESCLKHGEEEGTVSYNNKLREEENNYPSFYTRSLDSFHTK